MGRDQVIDARLVDWHRAVIQRFELVAIGLDDNHIGSSRGIAGSRSHVDIATADYGDAYDTVSVRSRKSSAGMEKERLHRTSRDRNLPEPRERQALRLDHGNPDPGAVRDQQNRTR